MKAANKLTLLVNAQVIKKAKVYAKKNGKSVSRIVEDYLVRLAEPEAKHYIPPDSITARLAGRLKGIPLDVNIGDEIAEYIGQKYK